MEDFINPDKHRAEIAERDHEIQTLQLLLMEKEKQIIEKDEMIYKKSRDMMLKMTDDQDDPFDNPTDYKNFSGSYSKIQPQLGTPGYTLPLEPDYTERKNLKKFYSVGGWCLIFQTLASYLIMIVLQVLTAAILKIQNPDSDSSLITDFMYGSSILVSINMLIYLICNVSNTFLGLKWAKISPRELIRTKNFHISQIIQYCSAGLLLWVISLYLYFILENIFSKFGINIVSDQSGLGTTPAAVGIMMVYTCIIAPITEEMLFRGMLLRVFSKANQRFAIFATAVFFGLAHGNIPQFVLAFLIGIFLAHITLKHNSIIPSIIVHCFINTFSTVFGKVLEIGNTVNTIATMLLFAAAIFGVVMLLVFRGEDKLPATTPKQNRRGFSIASCSVPFCISFLLQFALLLYNTLSN